MRGKCLGGDAGLPDVGNGRAVLTVPRLKGPLPAWQDWFVAIIRCPFALGCNVSQQEQDPAWRPRQAHARVCASGFWHRPRLQNISAIHALDPKSLRYSPQDHLQVKSSRNKLGIVRQAVVEAETEISTVSGLHSS